MDAGGDDSLVGTYEQKEFDNTTYAKDAATGNEIQTSLTMETSRLTMILMYI